MTTFLDPRPNAALEAAYHRIQAIREGLVSRNETRRLPRIDGILTCLAWTLRRSMTPPLSRGITRRAVPDQVADEKQIASDMLAGLCSSDRRGQSYVAGVYDCLRWISAETSSLDPYAAFWGSG